MRWVASMVADVFRLLARGRIFPPLRGGPGPGRPGPRLPRRARPIAIIVEQFPA